jgi:DNA-binding transcriptional LysR family regulator
MEMRHVRAFLAVAEELHFGRAAARLHIAQPAVSTAIRQLEEEIGATLFERTRRHVALSPAGRHFRPALQEALVRIEQGMGAARRAAEGQTGRIVVYLGALASFTPLPAALPRFCATHPDVQVTVKQAGTEEQLDALRSERCDLALTIMPGNVKPLRSAVVRSEPLIAVLPRTHRHARARAVRFEQLASEPMLLLPGASEPAINEAYRALCRRHAVEPRVAYELSQVESILAFIAAGAGITLMPRSIESLRHRGIALVPLAPRIEARCTLVWDPVRLSPAARALLDALRREAVEAS